jgi:diacylglycerol kinase family enzyme
MIMAGGDGSLMGLLGKARENGCDINRLVAGVLPYGTGNDLARTLNWGGTENDLNIYKYLPELIREICLNTEVKDLNVWEVTVSMREGDSEQ